jgi:hypothetical protein
MSTVSPGRVRARRARASPSVAPQVVISSSGIGADAGQGQAAGDLTAELRASGTGP